jgi:hypothetical protein
MRTPVPIPGNAQWRKSTSSDQGEACVELSHDIEVAAIRDSKNTGGPMLTLPASALSALLDTVAK